MAETARLFLCARCRVQVAICRHCDRGQRYCGQACAQAARGESLRQAGARYQRGRRGRLRHAERQGRYRARRRKVTHQGSPAPPAGASLAPESRAPTPPPGEAVLAGVRCRFCGRACSEFLRPGFLRPPRDGPWVHWPPPARAQSP